MKLKESPISFVLDKNSLDHASIILDAETSFTPILPSVTQILVTKYQFQTFYHPYANFMIRQLNRYGIDGLLDPIENGEAHDLRRQLMCEKPNQKFEQRYDLGYNIDKDNLPIEEFDFEYTGAYSIYNWELFFHVPFLIATRLSANQQFEEAQKWYHYIFNPTDVSKLPPDKTSFRSWKLKPFYLNTDIENIQTLLKLLSSEDPAFQQRKEALEAQIAD